MSKEISLNFSYQKFFKQCLMTEKKRRQKKRIHLNLFKHKKKHILLIWTETNFFICIEPQIVAENKQPPFLPPRTFTTTIKHTHDYHFRDEMNELSNLCEAKYPQFLCRRFDSTFYICFFFFVNDEKIRINYVWCEPVVVNKHSVNFCLHLLLLFK